MKHLLAFCLALVACGGDVQEGAGSSKPVPPAATTMAPAPSSTPAPPPYDVVRPAPAPSSLPACSPTSVGQCVLYERADATVGDDTDPFYPYNPALDETFFYWATSDHIWRVPKTGGARELVGSSGLGRPFNTGSGFTLDVDAVYWPGPKSLVRVPKAGGTSTMLATGVDASTFAVGATDAYVAERSKSRLVRVPLDGSSVTEVENGLDCTAIALDDANVYCRFGGGVARLPKDPTLLASTLVAAHGSLMLLFDAMLYVDDYGKLLSVPLAGGPSVPVPTGAPYGGLTGAGGALYMEDNGFRTVRRVPLDGSTVTTLTIEAGFSTVWSLEADSTGLYRLDARFTCTLDHVVPARPGDGAQDFHKCTAGLEELRVVRTPLVF